jgi:large subunit ribosomal protein L17
MRHLNSGRKLKRTSSHMKALMRNMATNLFEHKKISTTEAKAKELRPYAEKLITKAIHALKNEKQGLLPEGQKIDIHNRRIVGRFITNKAVLQELFDTIAPAVEERLGGYTRIIKTGTRRGDGGETAVIELVDYAAPLDGATNLKKKRKPGKPGAAPVKPKSDKLKIKAVGKDKVAEEPEEIAVTEPEDVVVAEVEDAVIVEEIQPIAATEEQDIAEAEIIAATEDVVVEAVEEEESFKVIGKVKESDVKEIPAEEPPTDELKETKDEKPKA